MIRKVIAVLIAVLLSGCAGSEIKKLDKSIFYPPLPQQPRLQFLTDIRSEDDLERKQSKLDEFLLGEETSVKRIGRPYDIGSVKGKIYISDRLYKSILIIDLEKNEFDSLSAIEEGSIEEPGGIWVTKDDMKYIADMGKKQILVFDSNNKFVKAYGGPQELGRPLDVAVYESRIYVCDFDKHKIIVFDKNSGNIVQEIGEPGKEPGQLYKPTHVVVDDTGNIYVNDNFNFRIGMYDPDGKYIRTIGGHGDAPGYFARPKGVGTDREKHIYVIDAAFENAQIFDVDTGQLLLFFGGFGDSPGSMYLPAGVHIDYDNIGYFQKYADSNFRLKYVVYVANLVGVKRLNIYGYGDWIGAPLSEKEKK